MGRTALFVRHRARPGQRVVLVFALAAALLGCEAPPAGPATNVALPALFGDHMVLQREVRVPVWGTADPGGELTVQLGGQAQRVIVESDGRWRTEIGPFDAGGPHELLVSGAAELRFTDVLIGEVWVGSGQSNMEMPLAGWGRVLDFEQEIAAAEHPQIRLFQVEKTIAFRPRSDVKSDGWRRCSPGTIAEFSSTAYFFGRQLHESLGVPVGLIHSSWGGTVAEAWTSAGALRELPDFAGGVAALEAAGSSLDAQLFAHEAAMLAWEAEIEARDAGDQASPAWSQPDVDDAGWDLMQIPTTWETGGLPGFNGIVWFRKTIDVPAAWAGRDATLHLGPIDDEDITWFNGAQVGAESLWTAPRHYPIPGAQLRAGRNVIVVRAVDRVGAGGIWGEPDALSLELREPTSSSPVGEPVLAETLPLAGPWRYRVGAELSTLPSPPSSPSNPNLPTVLHNAMLAPLMPYAIRGVIWYQGESNASRAHQYRELFPAMIRDWRARWELGDFPFLFVQLANFMPRRDEPADDAWAELREAQSLALALPNTGMAVAIDIGDAEDIHPKNKQEVGRRLALLARRHVYGEDVHASGPRFGSLEVAGARARLHFDAAEKLRTLDGAAPTGFAVAGVDRVFHWGQADVDGASVVVSSPAVPSPVAVRYAWAANPAGNLTDASGLPASPFRTDAWPGVTGGD